jgi:hypothetical protein
LKKVGHGGATGSGINEVFFQESFVCFMVEPFFAGGGSASAEGGVEISREVVSGAAAAALGLDGSGFNESRQAGKSGFDGMGSISAFLPKPEGSLPQCVQGRNFVMHRMGKIEVRTSRRSMAIAAGMPAMRTRQPAPDLRQPTPDQGMLKLEPGGWAAGRPHLVACC